MIRSNDFLSGLDRLQAYSGRFQFGAFLELLGTALEKRDRPEPLGGTSGTAAEQVPEVPP